MLETKLLWQPTMAALGEKRNLSPDVPASCRRASARPCSDGGKWESDGVIVPLIAWINPAEGKNPDLGHTGSGVVTFEDITETARFNHSGGHSPVVKARRLRNWLWAMAKLSPRPRCAVDGLTCDDLASGGSGSGLDGGSVTMLRKSVGGLCAGKPHAHFDGRVLETKQDSSAHYGSRVSKLRMPPQGPGLDSGEQRSHRASTRRKPGSICRNGVNSTPLQRVRS